MLSPFVVPLKQKRRHSSNIACIWIALGSSNSSINHLTSVMLSIFPIIGGVLRDGRKGHYFDVITNEYLRKEMLDEKGDEDA